MTETTAIAFLTSLLNKTLIIQIMDGRVFVGLFQMHGQRTLPLYNP